jgi:hypothetical protein
VLVERIGDRAVDDAVVGQHLLRTADAGIDEDSATGVNHEKSVDRPFVKHCCQVQPPHLQRHPSSMITERQPTPTVRTGCE